MKKRCLHSPLRPGGILRWSTACLLAGSLSSCERPAAHVVTEQDVEVAETQLLIEKMDTEKSKLINGEVSHNFHIPKVGYYHADAKGFYQHPYGYSHEGRYFMNGEWKDSLLPAVATSSRPSPETLKQVEKALEEEQKTAGNGQQSHGGGFGMGNMLMMYWMLSGNRGMFSPGNGFRQAGGQVGNWQRSVETQRGAVNRYAANNPGYQRMVEQSRASGAAVRPGQSVRGGFGTSASRNGGGSSFGS